VSGILLGACHVQRGRQSSPRSQGNKTAARDVPKHSGPLLCTRFDFGELYIPAQSSNFLQPRHRGNESPGSTSVRWRLHKGERSKGTVTNSARTPVFGTAVCWRVSNLYLYTKLDFMLAVASATILRNIARWEHNQTRAYSTEDTNALW
jgi:hypothetical protein